MNRLLQLTLIALAIGFGQMCTNLSIAQDQDQKTTKMSDNERQDRRLAKEFKVSESRIDSLRAQKLGYGEIRHVLTIADKMPGDIDNANINIIMQLRSEKEGWGRIAQQLEVKLHDEKNGTAEIHENKNAETHENGPVENHSTFNASAGSFHGTGGGMGHGR